MLFVTLAASVVTLYCDAYNITSGERVGGPVSWTVTVDLTKKYAYANGSLLYQSPKTIGNLEITPDKITIPSHAVSEIVTIEREMISRTTGAVVVQTNDLRKGVTDVFAKNDQDGRSRYAGICQPGALIPIPASKF